MHSQTASLKSELKSLLSQPLIARGIVKNYITSGAHDIVEDLLNNQRKTLSFEVSDECSM